MFKIEGTTIHITRGDKATITLTLDDYTFSVGDKVELRVYPKKAMEQEPVISKVVDVIEESEDLTITLTSEDTKIGEIVNKAVTYWYEIELNDDNTVIGYDENGPKEFIVYPEGVE